MIYYLIPESILCLIFTLYLYWKYAKKDVSSSVKYVTIIVWYFTFVTIILIPNDIEVIKDNTDGEKTKNMIWLQYMYHFIYWTIFILSWLVVPLLTEYEASGAFTSEERWKEAVLKNMLFILISAVVGILLLIYLVLAGQLSL